MDASESAAKSSPNFDPARESSTNQVPAPTVRSASGFNTRLAVLLAVVGLLGAAALIYRPDLDFISLENGSGKGNSKARGPTTGKASGIDVDWNACGTKHFLQPLTASDWFVIAQFPKPSSDAIIQQAKGKTDASAPNVVSILGFETPWENIEVLDLILFETAGFVVASFTEAISSETFEKAWRPTDVVLYGLAFHKATDVKGRMGNYAIMPNPRTVVIGTSLGVLRRVIAQAAGRQYPIRDELLPDKPAVTVNDLRFLRSPIKGDGDGGGGGGRGDRPGGLLKNFVVEDWAKDIAGGKVLLETGNVAKLQFNGRNNGTTLTMKAELEKLAAAALGGSKSKPAIEFKLENNVVLGNIPITGSFLTAMLRLLEPSAAKP